jgi:hypothetical protein
MRTDTNRWLIIFFLVLPGLCLSACASTSYIGIDYQVPAGSTALAGKQVSIQVADQRPTPETLAPSAREDFEHFTGLFSLSTVVTGQKPALVGAYDVSGLFQTALERRLKDLGATIAGTAEKAPIVVKVGLKHFLLERDGRRYLATLTYQASLAHPAGKTVSKTVSGNAERMKITGKRDMEKLLGEIFTDMINRLDITGLFEDAGY